MSDTGYTVSDGELVITLHEVAEGRFVVTTPLDPAVHTEAETIAEAFDMVRDAMASLREARHVRYPDNVDKAREKYSIY